MTMQSTASNQQLIYSVGIDVGLGGIGLAAVETDESGSPIRLLNCMVHTHDSGVSPDMRKTAETRLAQRGAARRARRLIARRRRRLRTLESWLSNEMGWVPASTPSNDPYAPWRARAELATHRIVDPVRQGEMLYLAAMHMAHHRGWRSAWDSAATLLEEQPDSPYMSLLRERLDPNGNLPQSLTPAQLIAHSALTPQIRMRGPQGVLGGKLHQSDNANELRRIGEVQGLDPAIVRMLILQLFDAKSPKGANSDRVGKDPLPGQGALRRAPKASLAFQRHRILNVLTNLRIRQSPRSEGRPLTASEVADVFDYLWTTDSTTSITWPDVASRLGTEVALLGGLSSRTDDGESHAGRPPRNMTDLRIKESKITPLVSWWRTAEEDDKEYLIQLIAGDLEDSDENDEVIEFLTSLDEQVQDKVQLLSMGSGRSAYSLDSLNRMSERMLSKGLDLHHARMAEFGVSDDWRPPADPIGAPLGNPAVDRVLKIIARYLAALESEFGTPTRVNIEHVRGALGSEAQARELTREQTHRRNRNATLAAELISQGSVGKAHRVSRTDLIRYQALTIQNCQCLYCGTPITFQTSELDHIVPRKGVGSSNRRENLAAVCGPCNRSKGNKLFSFWADQLAPDTVSLGDAVNRVRFWIRPAWMPTSEFRALQRDVTIRLKRRTEDPEFDGRSLESVAWMATELQRRVAAHFGEATKVGVFNGKTTSIARKASGIDRQIVFIDGAGKSRFDKRHHAVDATVIAMMRTTVSQVLSERDELREWEQLSGAPESWKEYVGRPEQEFQYRSWRTHMAQLVPILQAALDTDSIPLRNDLRLRLSNGKAHDDTVRPFTTIRMVSDAMSSELINRASTPALYCALTRHPDYTPEEGLVVDPDRQISVNGRRFGPGDLIAFFPSDKAAIAVRGGYAEIGNTLHHVRLFRSRSRGKWRYGFVRVYSVDLLKHQDEDLFSVALPDQAISLRVAEPAVREAIRSGQAEYLGWLVVGDELKLTHMSNVPKSLAAFHHTLPTVVRWQVSGAEDKSRLNLRPKLISEEGLREDAPQAVRAIFQKSWRISINELIKCKPIVIRRDALGRPRTNVTNGLPQTWQIPID